MSTKPCFSHKKRSTPLSFINVDISQRLQAISLPFYNLDILLSFEGMGSSPHDLGAELRMHYFTVNCDTFSNEEKVAAVVPETSAEVTCSEAMLALSFSTLLVMCLMKILERSALG